MSYKCTDCGKELKEINYVKPNLYSELQNLFIRRDPLCKKCWEKAIKKFEEVHKK